MNPELHHKWNAERDSSRGSDRQGEQVLKEQLQQHFTDLEQQVV